MSKVIQFLEALGSDATLARSDQMYAAAVANLGLEPAMQDALMRKDTQALNGLLGGRSNVLFLLAPAEDEQRPEGEEPAPQDAPAEESRSRLVAGLR